MTDETTNKIDEMPADEHEEHDHEGEHEHHHHHDHDEECCCGHHHHHHHDHDHEDHLDHDHEHEENDHEGECCHGHGHHHHHHDYDDEDHECGCGHHHHHHDHDHEGHHHHDHDHEHHHHDEKIEISTHEDATIATVRMSLGTDRQAAEAQLKSFMRAVAEESEAAGGMVGHIKFFLKESQGQMLSMTDLEEIQVKPAAAAEFTAEGVCIILEIDPDDLAEIVKLHYPGAV